MTTTYSAQNSASRAAVRAAVQAGSLTRSPVSSIIVCSILDISEQELDALYVEGTPDGYDGRRVEADLRRRFGLDGPDYLADALGDALSTRGVLTVAEGAWLDDEPEPDEDEELTEDRDDYRRGLAQHLPDGELYVVEYCALYRGDQILTDQSRILRAAGPVVPRDLGIEGPLEASPELFDLIDSYDDRTGHRLTDDDAAWLQAEEDAGRLIYPVGVR